MSRCLERSTNPRRSERSRRGSLLRLEQLTGYACPVLAPASSRPRFPPKAMIPRTLALVAVIEFASVVSAHCDPPAELINRTWYLNSIEWVGSHREVSPPSRSLASIRFDTISHPSATDGSRYVHIETGCNRYGADYFAGDDTVRFMRIGGTKMGCGDNHNDFEAVFTLALRECT